MGLAKNKRGSLAPSYKATATPGFIGDGSGLTGIVATDLDPSVAQLATVNLSAANLIAMNATPVQILAAPGAGLAILVESILFEITTTSTQFTGGGVVTFPYHGGSVATHAGSVPAATVTATAGTTYTLLGPAVASNGTVVPANTGVDITNASAAFAAGTGTAKVQIKYRIVTL